MIFSSHILKNYLCIYSFILLLCWASGCFGCGEPGLLFLAARRLLVVVFSLVAEQELQGMQVSVPVVLRLSCSTARGIFPDQGSNRVPCIGRDCLPNRHKQKKCDATTGSLWSCGTWILPHKSCDFRNCPSLTELQFSYL